MPHILLIEDEVAIASTLQKGLSKNGFKITWFDSGLKVDPNSLNGFDLVILDWMLPHISGVDLLSKWRKSGLIIPVLMLTARDRIDDKIKGFELGADDYMSKIFEWPELIARIKALIRRSKGFKQNQLDEFSWDTQSKVVIHKGISLKLTPKEYAILVYFLENRDITISKSTLAKSAYDLGDYPSDNAIERHIKSIRKKLQDDYIQTVHGFGYRFNTTSQISQA